LLKAKRFLAVHLFVFVILACGDGVSRTSQADGDAAQAIAEQTDRSENEPRVRIFGVVRAERSLVLSLGFGGSVHELRVREGESVAADEVLIEFGVQGLEEERAEYERSLAESRVRIRDIERQLERVSAAEHPDIVQAELDRTRARVDAGTVSREILEERRRALETAIRDRRRAEASLVAVSDRLAATRRELRTRLELEAIRRQQAAAELSRLADEEARPEVSIPYLVNPLPRAIVDSILVEAGVTFRAGETLLRLIDESSIIVEAELPEEFLPDIMVGSPAEVTPLADSTRIYNGEIVSIARLARRLGNETIITARVRLDDRDSFLLPGMNVDIAVF
jgi:multidrug resistance efflux pump